MFTGAWRPWSCICARADAKVVLLPSGQGPLLPLPYRHEPAGTTLGQQPSSPDASLAGVDTSTPRGLHPPSRFSSKVDRRGRESPHHEGWGERQGFRAPRPGGCLWPRRPLCPDDKDGENQCPQPYPAEISC